MRNSLLFILCKFEHLKKKNHGWNLMSFEQCTYYVGIIGCIKLIWDIINKDANVVIGVHTKNPNASPKTITNACVAMRKKN
jgi:hypothetical protein